MNHTRLLLGILLLAAILRFGGLATESLWLDEGITALQASRTLPQIVAEFKDETQTVLFVILEKFWCSMWGISEFSLRFLPAVFGILAVWGIYLLASELFSVQVGLYSAFFLAINPFAIHYSQDARPYALFLASAIFSLYFLLQSVNTPRPAFSLGYVVATVVSLYTHPLAPLLLLVHFSALYIYWDSLNKYNERITVWPAFFLIVVSIVLYIPQLLLMRSAIFQKMEGGSRAGWIPIPEWYAPLSTVKHYFMHPALAALFAFILVAGIITVIRRNRKLHSGMLWMSVLILCSMILPWLLSFLLTPVYVSRYTIPALTGFIILLGFIFAEERTLVWNVALSALVILNTVTLFQYYTRMDKEPWRETAVLLQKLTVAGDVVVLDAFFGRDMLNYYYHPPAGVQLITPDSSESIPSFLDSASHVWVVQAYDFKTNVTQELYTRIKQHRIPGKPIHVQGWAAPNPHAYWLADIHLTEYKSAL